MFPFFQSFMFQLDETQFPTLATLKQREKELRKDLKLLDEQYDWNPKINHRKGSHKVQDLIRLQEDIQGLENSIINNLWAVIVKQATTIHHSLDILARLDTIFARAFYALECGGVIPYMDEDGQIQVDNFVHPILVTMRDQNKGFSSTVEPIQLSLPYSNTNNSALVITGENGKRRLIFFQPLHSLALLFNLTSI
jgi:hypothetical protein